MVYYCSKYSYRYQLTSSFITIEITAEKARGEFRRNRNQLIFLPLSYVCLILLFRPFVATTRLIVHTHIAPPLTRSVSPIGPFTICRS